MGHPVISAYQLALHASKCLSAPLYAISPPGINTPLFTHTSIEQIKPHIAHYLDKMVPAHPLPFVGIFHCQTNL